MIVVREQSVVTEPGFYRMPAEKYHADPTPGIALSNSIINSLVDESPLHAWAKHPKLNKHGTDEASNRMDFGSVVHKLVLGEGSQIDVLPFGDYKKNIAKAARDLARAAGKIPVLEHHHEAALVVAKPLRAAVEELVGMPITDCLRETVMVWDRLGIWCKAMIDLMTPDGKLLVDLKTTEASVAPSACEKRVYDSGYHVQSAFYMEGMDALDPDNAGRRRFMFLWSEQSSPFAVSPPIEVSEAGLTLAAEQIQYAAELWADCLEKDEWPSFGSDWHMANPPAWMLSRHEERMQLEGGSPDQVFQRRSTRDHIRDLEFLYSRREKQEEEA